MRTSVLQIERLEDIITVFELVSYLEPSDGNLEERNLYFNKDII
jgi:hypothetical protein